MTKSFATYYAVLRIAKQALCPSDAIFSCQGLTWIRPQVVIHPHPPPSPPLLQPPPLFHLSPPTFLPLITPHFSSTHQPPLLFHSSTPTSPPLSTPVTVTTRISFISPLTNPVISPLTPLMRITLLVYITPNRPQANSYSACCPLGCENTWILSWVCCSITKSLISTPNISSR